MKLILFTFILVKFCLYFFSDNNFYKLIMIFGKKGSGKSSHIAKKALYFVKRGYKVYSNLHLNVDGVLFYDPADIGIYSFEPGSVVFCDEVGLIWHNRDYKNFKKCVISWFKYQRQYKIRMYLYSQSFDVDKVLRDLTDQIFLISRFGKFSILRPVSKGVTVSTDSNGQGTLADTYKIGFLTSWKFTFLPRYYGLFDSYNPPELPLIYATLEQSNEVSQVYMNSKKWLLYQLKLVVQKYVQKIKKMLNKIKKVS